MKTRKRNTSAAAAVMGRAGRSQTGHSVTVVVPYSRVGRTRCLRPLLARYGFEQSIEVFQPGIFDDHSSAAVLVFDRDLQAERSLQCVASFTDIGVERRFLFFFTLGFFLRIQQSLHVAFGLAY